MSISEAGLDEYFMPCVLQTEDLNDTVVDSLPYTPLIVSFECGYCPVGVCSALVVYLLQHSQKQSSTLKWKIPHGATVHRNKISFLFGYDLNKITMIARPAYFEVQYDWPANQLHTPVHTVCSHVREDLRMMLRWVSEDIALYPGHKQVVWDLLLVHVCEAIGGASKI